MGAIEGKADYGINKGGEDNESISGVSEFGVGMCDGG